MIRLITRRRLQRLQHARDVAQSTELALSRQIDDLRWQRADLEAANKGLLQHSEELAAAEERHRGLVRRAMDAYEARVSQAIGERDQARAIAVDLEQQLAAQADLVTGLRATIAARLEWTQRAGAEYDTRIAALTADRDRALALAETARAAAEAADIPIVAGLDPDDYLTTVKAALADIAARKKANAKPCEMCGAGTFGDRHADVLPNGRHVCGGCFSEVAS
ncbi:hypothetical protein [Embleya sp. NPDC001921]